MTIEIILEELKKIYLVLEKVKYRINDFEKMYGSNEVYPQKAKPFVYGWISVKDRLPEHMQDVLVAAGYEIKISNFTGEWLDEECLHYVLPGRDITHWMPLPPLPEIK